MLSTLSPISNVESDLGRLASSFRRGQIRREHQKERAANYGIDDG